MYFDSHTHYDDQKFSKDRKKILNNLKKNNVDYIVNVGADIKSSQASIKLASEHDFIYAAVGVHPHDVKDLDEDDVSKIYALGSQDKVVAIGEIGLDYYYENSPKYLQKDWFIEQIELAKELDLPIIVHSRDAAQDTFDIIQGTEAQEVGGVIHCFAESVEMAKEYVKLGFYLGIGGVVTFSNAQKLKDVVKEIPLEHLLIETDCPYLAPVPNRGERNDSTNLKYIVEEIAKIKGITPEAVAEQTMKNAQKLFKIEVKN